VLASLLVATNTACAGQPPAPGPDAFGDDDGSAHEAALDAAAAAGWITGTAPGVSSFDEPTTRGQLASFVARLLGTLVAHGAAELPG
jgi:hypothetical protein